MPDSCKSAGAHAALHPAPCSFDANPACSQESCLHAAAAAQSLSKGPSHCRYEHLQGSWQQQLCFMLWRRVRMKLQHCRMRSFGVNAVLIARAKECVHQMGGLGAGRSHRLWHACSSGSSCASSLQQRLWVSAQKQRGSIEARYGSVGLQQLECPTLLLRQQPQGTGDEGACSMSSRKNVWRAQAASIQILWHSLQKLAHYCTRKVNAELTVKDTKQSPLVRRYC